VRICRKILGFVLLSPRFVSIYVKLSGINYNDHKKKTFGQTLLLICCIVLRSKQGCGSKGVGRKISRGRGGSNGKRPKNSSIKPLSTISVRCMKITASRCRHPYVEAKRSVMTFEELEAEAIKIWLLNHVWIIMWVSSYHSNTGRFCLPVFYHFIFIYP